MKVDRLDDHYAVLGVAPDISRAELRRVWRRLALLWHPDRAGEAATVKFQKLAAAYGVLSSPAARAEYDHGRVGAARRSAPAADPTEAGSGDGPARRRKPPRAMLTRVSGPLTSLLACGVAARAEPGVIELFLKPDEAATGGIVTVSLRVAVHCASCSGETCDRCGGRGTIQELFSAWLTVPPGVMDGAALHPSVPLRGMVRPVQFRIRVRGGRKAG